MVHKYVCKKIRYQAAIMYTDDKSTAFCAIANTLSHSIERKIIFSAATL